MAHAKNPSIENCINLFGEHPEDVIAPISSASEALLWLEEICKTIAMEPIDPSNTGRAQRLACAGAYLAASVGQFAGNQHETLIDRLRTTGFASIEGVTA